MPLYDIKKYANQLQLEVLCMLRVATINITEHAQYKHQWIPYMYLCEI